MSKSGEERVTLFRHRAQRAEKALREIAAITDGAGWLNLVDIGTDEIVEKIHDLGEIARAALRQGGSDAE